MLLCFLFANESFAQLENIRLETYYISDANDATDEYGGELPEGSVTYRIYVDLAPDARLKAIYADENHRLWFKSSAPFFNHVEDGVSFGHDQNRNRYDEGTIPLDTWLALGQISKPFSAGAYFGIPKEMDNDGSFVGGANNDGGSMEIPDGLLANDNADAGIPLTDQDGITLIDELPEDWLDFGFLDALSGTDSSIFGAIEPQMEFESNQSVLRNSGTKGVGANNEVLIAQLTTKGELEFEINLEVEYLLNGEWVTAKYVSTDNNLASDEVLYPLLKYPWVCGCKDPDYLEASTAFACEDQSLCVTPVVFGCMDELACNYDPAANYNIEDLCCYVGYCNDRDIELVCPDLPIKRGNELASKIKTFPNPTNGEVHCSIDVSTLDEIVINVFDVYSNQVKKQIVTSGFQTIDLYDLPVGVYFLQFLIDDVVVTKKVNKI